MIEYLMRQWDLNEGKAENDWGEIKKSNYTLCFDIG